MDDCRADFQEDLKTFMQLCMNNKFRSIAEANGNTESLQRLPQARTSSSI